MIPKILHFIWIQGLAAMPPEYRRCFDSWAPKHPGWKIKLWDREMLVDFRNAWVLDVPNPTVQCEVLRFETVLKDGGIFLDADVECLRPIDGLVEGLDAFVSMRNRKTLENNGFGAEAGHPWLDGVIGEVAQYEGKLSQVLGIDKPFREATELYPDLIRLPWYRLHMGVSDQDQLRIDEAYAIHHRFSPWMADDVRYRGYYERLHGGQS
jgi:hypothetical protein